MRLLVLVLVLVALCVGARAAEVVKPREEGPRMSDKQFFDALNLDYAGLEKVKAAVNAGDMQASKHEFAEYMRHREKPIIGFDWKARPKLDKRPDGVDTRDADKVMQHILYSVSVDHKYEGDIDWTLDPINYREWPWQLNRHHIWVALARAYWATGEEKYAKEFVFQLNDWVRKCPVPDDSGNQGETWRTIEQGIRMGQMWPEVFYRFLTSPSFDDESIVTMVKSMAEHAQHLMKFYTTGNWLTMECNGLMHVGVLFPEFKDAAEWRKTAMDRLYTELDKQVYPDGAQIELTTGYHQVALWNFEGAWQIAHLNGVEVPKDYTVKMEKMFDYNLDASMPDESLPGLNDASRIDLHGIFGQSLEFFPDRKDYKWMATAGKEGTKPTVGSIALPWSGHMVMRTGWDPNDLYMLFDAGPFGYGHQHEDALSFVIYAYGKYMLVDPGTYPYDSSEWRKYVLSTRAHNTIMVDGCEQHRRDRPRREYVLSKPMPIKWASSEKFDYARSTYEDGYAHDNSVKVKHDRTVFFVKPEYWIVVDRLTPSDLKSHKYDSAFHLDMTGAEVDDATKTVKTTDAQGPNLTIVPMADEGLKVQIVSGQKEPIVQGWMPGGVTTYSCRPILTPVFEKEQAGRTTMAYVFYPTPEGKKCPITKVEPLSVTGDDGAVGVAITFEDGRVDYFVQSEKAGARVKFDKFDSSAPVTYIRTEKGQVTSSAPVTSIEDLSNTTVRHKFGEK